MDEVTVNKAQLIEKLRTNMANHKAIYEEALKGFCARARDMLAAKLQDVEAGRLNDLNVSLRAPTDHTRDYQLVLDMLEWDQHEQITLTVAQFRNLVNDDWDWMQSWLTHNRRFSAAAENYANAKGL